MEGRDGEKKDTFFPSGAIFLTALAMVAIFIDPFKANMSHLLPTKSTYMLFLSAFYMCATGVDISVNFSDVFNIYSFYLLGTVVVTMPGVETN